MREERESNSIVLHICLVNATIGHLSCRARLNQALIGSSQHSDLAYESTQIDVLLLESGYAQPCLYALVAHCGGRMD